MKEVMGRWTGYISSPILITLTAKKTWVFAML
jgi:hypothetical protein